MTLYAGVRKYRRKRSASNGHFHGRLEICSAPVTRPPLCSTIPLERPRLRPSRRLEKVSLYVTMWNVEGIGNMLYTRPMAYVLAGLLGVAAIAGPPIVRTANTAEHGKWADMALGRLISGHIGRLMVLRSELDLTDQQKAKLKETIGPRKPEIAKAAKGVWEKRTALVDAVLAEQPNEEAIRHAADDLGKAIGDAAVLASKVVADVRPVLASEQREKVQKCRQECQAATAKFFQKATNAE